MVTSSIKFIRISGTIYNKNLFQRLNNPKKCLNVIEISRIKTAGDLL